MLVIDKIVIRSKDKKAIIADLHMADAKTKSPIVIFCQGYQGFKDWGDMNLLAKAQRWLDSMLISLTILPED